MKRVLRHRGVDITRQEQPQVLVLGCESRHLVDVPKWLVNFVVGAIEDAADDI